LKTFKFAKKVSLVRRKSDQIIFSAGGELRHSLTSEKLTSHKLYCRRRVVDSPGESNFQPDSLTSSSARRLPASRYHNASVWRFGDVLNK